LAVVLLLMLVCLPKPALALLLVALVRRAWRRGRTRTAGGKAGKLD
jgi:hypothetical protein